MIRRSPRRGHANPGPPIIIIGGGRKPPPVVKPQDAVPTPFARVPTNKVTVNFDRKVVASVGTHPAHVPAVELKQTGGVCIGITAAAPTQLELAFSTVTNSVGEALIWSAKDPAIRTKDGGYVQAGTYRLP